MAKDEKKDEGKKDVAVPATILCKNTSGIEQVVLYKGTKINVLAADRVDLDEEHATKWSNIFTRVDLDVPNPDLIVQP